MYKGIPDKQASYKLYESGRFGNQLRNWKSCSAFYLASYLGSVTMRYSDEGGQFVAYHVTRNKINTVIDKWITDGADIYKIKFNESAPDDHLVIQGEIREDPKHKFVLSYSTDKVPMREAMRNPKSMLGNEAIYLLQEHFSKESMRNLKHLFATWPQAVVEFSCYDHMLGNVPENNTIFWEVRNY